MGLKMDINTAEFTIDKKYTIKPLMTIEEIKNSNLKEIMDERSKIQLEEDLIDPLFIRGTIYGEEVSVRLDIAKGKLIGIYIAVDSEEISECYRADNKERLERINNIQIAQIEGINEIEHKKVQELYNMYGEFPSEDSLAESIKNLQNEVKSASDQINHINQEKNNLEAVEEAFNIVDDIYNKYEESGFDESVIKENADKLIKYEKVKEILKKTDIENNVELRKRIDDYNADIEKLEQIQNNLNMQSNQISDLYSAYQKYKDIGTKKLNKLKKELICNLKAKDELKNILAHNNDKMTHDFCEEKIKEIDMSIETLDNEISGIVIVDKNKIDDMIDYLKQQLSNEERYLTENNSLNSSDTENEIKKLTENAKRELNSSFVNKLDDINEFYNLENKIAEVQKEMKLKEKAIELQKEGKILEIVKEKLEIIDRYKPIVDIMDKYKTDEFFKNSYENKYGEKINEYNQTKNELESVNINTWDEYLAIENIYIEKQKELLGNRNISEIISLDNIKEFEKITKYKIKQNKIIEKYSEPLSKDIDENINIQHQDEVSGFERDLLKDNEKDINQNDLEQLENEVLNNVIDENINIHNQDEVVGFNKDELTDNEEDIRQNNLEQSENEVLNNVIDENIDMHDEDEVSGFDNDPLKDEEKDIQQNKINKLKNELLCNLKAQDQLMNIYFHNNDNIIQDFCGEKIKEIDINIENLDKEINGTVTEDKSEIDDIIDYLKQKLIDENRYSLEDNSLNDISKENKIKEITKSAMEKIDSDVFSKFKDINELYNIEKEVDEIQKEIDLKENIVEFRTERENLKNAEKMLKIKDEYVSPVENVNKSKSNKFLVGLYKKNEVVQEDPETEKYNLAIEYLESVNINSWDEYAEAKEIFEIMEKKILGDVDVSSIKSLNIKRDLDKIDEHKNKMKEIIKQSNSVY